jgi:uncharacterized protein GlcG (DUF336 family)
MTDPFTLRPAITLATALRLVEAVIADAGATGLAVAVVVTDASGTVVASARMDDAPLGALRLAGDKAYTSAIWQTASGDLRLSSQPGGADWGITSTENGRIVVYDGGLPILSDGVLAGAIGISGVTTGEQDVALAQAALAKVLPAG